MYNVKKIVGLKLLLAKMPFGNWHREQCATKIFFWREKRTANFISTAYNGTSLLEINWMHLGVDHKYQSTQDTCSNLIKYVLR